MVNLFRILDRIDTLTRLQTQVKINTRLPRNRVREAATAADAGGANRWHLPSLDFVEQPG
jgi:hypothetical protein